MTELSSQVVNSSIYGQEAGVCQVNQGCGEKQLWKNQLLVRMSSTAHLARKWRSPTSLHTLH